MLRTLHRRRDFSSSYPHHHQKEKSPRAGQRLISSFASASAATKMGECLDAYSLAELKRILPMVRILTHSHTCRSV